MQKAPIKLFLLGDFESENGPGIANQNLCRSLTKSNIFDLQKSVSHGKISRIFEMIEKMYGTDILFICSASKINYIAIRLARLWHKKILYLVHGYSSFEKSLNEPDQNNDELKQYEHYIFSNVDRIICVSRFAMDFIKKDYPQYSESFCYLYNTISGQSDVNGRKVYSLHQTERYVFSLGGAAGCKKNDIVAEAVRLLNEKYDKNMKLMIVGPDGVNGKRLRNNPYVIWKEYLPHDSVMELMTRCCVYVQNSSFETFGMAPIEALFQGASILLSKHMGCIDLFDHLKETDVIHDCDDPEEIAIKLLHLLEEGNNERLRSSFHCEAISAQSQREHLEAIIAKL